MESGSTEGAFALFTLRVKSESQLLSTVRERYATLKDPDKQRLVDIFTKVVNHIYTRIGGKLSALEGGSIVINPDGGSGASTSDADKDKIALIKVGFDGFLPGEGKLCHVYNLMCVLVDENVHSKQAQHGLLFPFTSSKEDQMRRRRLESGAFHVHIRHWAWSLTTREYKIGLSESGQQYFYVSDT